MGDVIAELKALIVAGLITRRQADRVVARLEDS
jgi:hypothetical protein